MDRATPGTTPEFDDVVGQGAALVDRTRHALFTAIREAPGPVGVAELSSRLGLNHTGVRRHLRRLREAGLVAMAPETPSGRGRPPQSYCLTPGAIERWQSPSPHAALSGMLLSVLMGEGNPRDVGRAYGARMATGIAADDPVAKVEGAARRMGFAPSRDSGPVGDIVLNRCPFRDGARAAPHVVCELHRGMAEGVAESTGTVRIEDLVVSLSKDGGCRLVLAS